MKELNKIYSRLRLLISKNHAFVQIAKYFEINKIKIYKSKIKEKIFITIDSIAF